MSCVHFVVINTNIVKATEGVFNFSVRFLWNFGTENSTGCAPFIMVIGACFFGISMLVAEIFIF